MRPSLEEIIAAVATGTGVSAVAICGHVRVAKVVRARHGAVWLATALTRLSFTEIGEQLGRDRTTIRAAVQSASAQRDRDPAYAAWLDAIVARFAPEIDPPDAAPEKPIAQRLLPLPTPSEFATGVGLVELALIYLEDGARVTAAQKLRAALKVLAPASGILAESEATDAL